MTDELRLGRLLGRHEAFNVVAARCSTADAMLLREIRDQRLYEGHAEDWDEFCANYLHISRPQANRIIGLLNEFGPTYFEIAQLTRISPATYRAIAPSIRDRTIQHEGEAIALIPENAEKVAAAVARLRTAAAKPSPPPVDAINAAGNRCAVVFDEINGLIHGRENRERIQGLLSYVRSRVELAEQSLQLSM